MFAGREVLPGGGDAAATAASSGEVGFEFAASANVESCAVKRTAEGGIAKK